MNFERAQEALWTISLQLTTNKSINLKTKNNKSQKILFKLNEDLLSRFYNLD